MRPSTFFDFGAREHGDAFTLQGPEARHAVAAQRVSAGEVVDIVDGAGMRLRCEVVSASGHDHLNLRVIERMAEIAPVVRVTVIQPLIKDAELAVDQLTQAGADVIVPWQAQHSVVQWRGDRVAKSHTKWVHAAQQAAKQSRRAWWPEVTPLAHTADVVARMARADGCIVLDADAQRSIGEAVLPAQGELLVILGPEGGFSATESEAFAAAQWVHLVPTVVRSSLVGAAALFALLGHMPDNGPGVPGRIGS